jgi:dolichol-phosphate mannosyltransferase
MKIVIIVPTYNERGNIARLIHALQEQFGTIRHEMAILVVDDDSPDGTADIVRSGWKDDPGVVLLSGRKQGLGAAYVRGMQYAITDLKADAVMEMDADFSHSPEDVARLIGALDQGADFVIGSRYVEGGKIPEDWSLLRTMNSRWGNFFARSIAGIGTVSDCTAGFRAIRASVIRNIDLRALNVRGYAFQVSLLFHAIRNGAAVREIPVEFVDRKHGQTKLGLYDIIEFMANAFVLRLQRYRSDAWANGQHRIKVTKSPPLP